MVKADFLNKIDFENVDKLAVVAFKKDGTVECGYFNMTLRDKADAKQQIEFDILDDFIRVNGDRYGRG